MGTSDTNQTTGDQSQIGNAVSEDVNRKREQSHDVPRNTEWAHRPESMLAVWGFVVAIAVALIYFGQLIYIRRSVDLAEKTARIDQRAWMSIKIEDFTPSPMESTPIGCTLHFSNTGKTPAKQVQVYVRMVMVPNGHSPDFEYAERPIMVGSSGIELPGLPENTVRVNIPTKVPGSHYTEDLRLSKTDVDDLNQGRSYIATFGRIQYLDVFGTQHWIQFCGWHAYNRDGFYNIFPCADYNNVDSD